MAAKKVKVRSSSSSVDVKIDVRRLISPLLVPRLELRGAVSSRHGDASCPCDANHSGYVFDAGNNRMPATDMKPGLLKDLAFEAPVLQGVSKLRPTVFPAA